jgi:hypothetical protein
MEGIAVDGSGDILDRSSMSNHVSKFIGAVRTVITPLVAG